MLVIAQLVDFLNLLDHFLIRDILEINKVPLATTTITMSANVPNSGIV